MGRWGTIHARLSVIKECETFDSVYPDVEQKSAGTFTYIFETHIPFGEFLKRHAANHVKILGLM